ncbi:hypothetical protein V6Z11_D09G046200 [Gossypium hirsutum]
MGDVKCPDRSKVSRLANILAQYTKARLLFIDNCSRATTVLILLLYLGR